MLLAGLLLVLLWLVVFGALPAPPESADDSGEGGSAEPHVQDERGARAAVVARSEAGERATLTDPLLVHGLVLDDRTSEPVPGLVLVLRVEGAGVVEERVPTDADGRFRAERPLPAGEVEALVLDLEREVAKLRRPADVSRAEEWSIRVAIGPTVPLAFQEGADFDPSLWRARIVETTRPRDAAGDLAVTAAGLSMIAPDPAHPTREWEWLALRAGDPPWIRYPSASFPPSLERRVLVELEGGAAGRRGTAPIGSTLGVQAPALFGRFAFIASLSGRVVDERGEGLAARIAALPPELPGDLELRPPAWRTGESAEDGEFTLSGLAPGRVRLCVLAPGRPALERELRLDAGHTELEAPLALVARVGEARGKPAERAPPEGAPRPPTGLLQIRSTRAGPLLPAWIDGFDERRMRGLERRGLRLGDLPYDLPADELEVTWISVPGRRDQVLPHLRPGRAVLTLPVEALPFQAARAGRNLRLRAVVRVAEREVRDWEISFEPGGALLGVSSSRDFPRVGLVPEAPLAFGLWRNGRRPVFADRSALREEGGRLVHESESLPGWGAVVWMRVGRPEQAALEVAGRSGEFALELRPGPGARGELQFVVTLDGRLGSVNVSGAASPPATLTEILEAPPLPGVQVLEGDTTLATSDREGVARIGLDHRPERLVLVAEGWQLVWLQRLEGGTNAVQRWVAWLDRE